MILLNITICTTMEIMELVFTTCTYNHHTVTVGQYQGTLMSCHTVNITCYTLLVYTKAIKFVFFIYENTCIYQYHDIEVKMISRSNITIMINIIILCSSKYTVATYRIAQNFDSGKVRQHLTNQACQKV